MGRDLLRLAIEEDCKRFVKYHHAFTEWQIKWSDVPDDVASRVRSCMGVLSRSLPERLYYFASQGLTTQNISPSARLRRSFQQEFYLAKRDLTHAYYDPLDDTLGLHNDTISAHVVLEMSEREMQRFLDTHTQYIREEIAKEQDPTRSCILHIFEHVVQQDGIYVLDAYDRLFDDN